MLTFRKGGGNTLFPGFADRLLKELNKSLAQPDAKVFADSNRRYSAWIGGSILSSLSAFDEMVVTMSDYNEYGPSIIRRKCP